MEIYFGIFVVIAAYFLKGFSGFGPALIMIPSLSILYDPITAILITAFLDFLAGLLLLLAVRREVLWTFVLPVFLTLAVGAFIGTILLDIISIELLKQIIGLSIIVFAVLIFFDREREPGDIGPVIKNLRYPVGFISGILGGMLSISGPPLVIYMKWNYDKTFFRSQLIGIFLLGAGWRLFLYRLYDIPVEMNTFTVLLFTAAMLLGLGIGNRIHLSVNEITFNRIIALIIIVPAIRLILFV
jgi:uncharacterized membrane protein YfcA